MRDAVQYDSDVAVGDAGMTRVSRWAEVGTVTCHGAVVALHDSDVAVWGARYDMGVAVGWR